ncbi:MAG: hypothetical protein ABSC37_03130 [Xanthobacteraceae bacterium]
MTKQSNTSPVIPCQSTRVENAARAHLRFTRKREKLMALMAEYNDTWRGDYPAKVWRHYYDMLRPHRITWAEAETAIRAGFTAPGYAMDAGLIPDRRPK